MKTQVTLLLIAAALISGCVTEKKRLQICNGCPEKIVRKDCVIVKEVKVPVTLPPVPGPTIYITSPCDSVGKLKPFVVEQKKNGIKTVIKGTAKGLEITSNLEDSTKALVNVPQKEIHGSTTSVITQKEPCQNERTAWDGFFRIGFFIELILLALAGVLIYIRR